MKGDEVVREGLLCNTHGKQKKCTRNIRRKNPKERGNLEELDVRLKIILKRTLKKWDVKMWTAFS
jgi:hypothetical protein